MDYISTLLAHVWRLFSVPWPGTSLTCSQVILGIFVVRLSIAILQSLLSLVSIGSGAASAIKSRRGESYSSYARNRARYETYDARYSHAKKEKVSGVTSETWSSL